MHRCLACCLLLIAWHGWLLAEKPSPAATPSAQEIEALIDQLHSPNDAPTKRRGPQFVYPATYDHNGQEKVKKAFDTLRVLGIPAFPYLFEHLNDTSYSITEDRGFDFDRNYTVGDACQFVLQANLTPYDQFVHVPGDPRHRWLRPSYVEHCKLHDAESAQSWWVPRKDKPLRELQIEALEWTIAEEAKTPNRYPESERSYLQNELDRLRESQQPLGPGWLFSK